MLFLLSDPLLPLSLKVWVASPCSSVLLSDLSSFSPQTSSFDTHVIIIRPFIWISIRYEKEIKGTDTRKGRNKIIFVHR